MNAPRSDEQQAKQPEQLEDLAGGGNEVQDGEQVKGGFNPQPEPPKVAPPVYRPPVFKGGIR